MSNETVKKAFGIASKIFTWIIIAVTVFMMIFTLISTFAFDKNDRNLFGLRFYVVLSDSMSPSENNKDDKVHFSAGDIVLIKSVKNPTALEEGDIIAFVNQNTNLEGKNNEMIPVGVTITHRIRRVERDDKGEIQYVTYGTNTGVDDESPVKPHYVIGKYAGKLPGVGNFFQFLKTTPGYIVCILVPFLLLILWQGVNTAKLFKQYKREQMADIEAERAEIAKEREQSLQMMRELQALKEQLAMQNNAGATVASVTQNEEADTASVTNESEGAYDITADNPTAEADASATTQSDTSDAIQNQ